MSQPVAYHCGLYRPGHDVHWIQAKIALRERSERPIYPGRLIRVQSDGLICVEVSGVCHRLWNHDVDRLKRLVAENSGEITYQPGIGLLRTSAARGEYMFCVDDFDSPERRPCPDSPPSGSLTDLLRDAGGFSLPGRDALALSEGADEG